MHGNGREAARRVASDSDSETQSLPGTFEQPLLLKNLYDLCHLEEIGTSWHPRRSYFPSHTIAVLQN